MINNYLKTKPRISKKGEYLEPEHIFFFDDRDPDSIKDAWRKATAVHSDPMKIAVFHAPERGRYPHEAEGEEHPVVRERLAPISARTLVMGYPFEKPFFS